MSKQGWFSAVIGAVLIGSVIGFIRRKNAPQARASGGMAVEVLAEELKEAWSEHHTRM